MAAARFGKALLQNMLVGGHKQDGTAECLGFFSQLIGIKLARPRINANGDGPFFRGLGFHQAVDQAEREVIKDFVAEIFQMFQC